MPSPSPGIDAELMSVSVTAQGTAYAAGWTCNAACAGGTGGYQPLLLFFDGDHWSRAITPDPGSSTRLTSVSANADGTVWVVGETCAADCEASTATWQSLILRASGNGWNLDAQPISGIEPIAVASGPGDAGWLVGACTSWCRATQAIAVALHRTGTSDSWSPEAIPNPGDRAGLVSVSLGAGGTAWAVGEVCTSACGTTTGIVKPLVIHWDGTSWSVTPSPASIANGLLSGVSAGPDGNAWAVGWTCKPGCSAMAQDNRTLILSWTGTSWVQVPSPTPSSVTALNGTSIDPKDPGSDAWAVGYYCASNCTTASSELVRPVILHWTGRAWVTSVS